GYIVGLQGLHTGELCPAEQSRVRGIWSPERAEQLKDRFDESGLRFAEQSATRVIAIFDSYADAWVAAKRSACLRDLGGAELRASAASSCLDERLEAWGLTIDLLMSGDDTELATTVERSISIAAGLPDLHGCERSGAERSWGPLSRATQRALSRLLHRVRALLRARQLGSAGRVLEGARAQLPVDRDEIEAQLSLVEAELALLLAKSELATQHLDRVIELAGSAGLLHLIAEAAVMQAEVEGVLLRNSKAARPLLRVARIALATAQSGPLLRGHLELVQARVEYSGNHFDAGRRATEAAIAAFDLAGERGQVKLGEGLQLLAVQAFGAGDYEHARTLALRALDLQIRLLGDAHPDLAKTIQVLGALELVAGHGSAAVSHFERAADLLEESLGADHPNYGQILVNLGNAYVESEDPGRALVQYQRAQRIFEAALRPEDPRVLGCLINIGGVQRALGHSQAAELAFRRVIERSRELADTGDQSLAMALANLARVLQDQGRLGEAEEAHVEALSIRKSSLGPDHPKTAASYDALGRFLLESGRPEEGAPLIDAAFAIRERRLGRGHPDFVRSQVNRALVWRARHQLSA
ncbi:MAG TPA: tetratricopeptide repeat protein, partial [Nannocystis exedens]|nr:tetratricopeptide repeat protein [Nannocystis exedens]